MAQVELRNLVKNYGAVNAVKQANITFEDGAFTTLLGPSGCGKTTILRMIAGLETPSAGDICVNDQRINDVPIHKRNLGLVFQNYALFPHKTIGENIAFGLKYRGVSKSAAVAKVKNALDIVRLPGIEDRYPAQLSGGQQQRIALARAIVIEPDVLLLDEPLSALDANLREEMRIELKAIQHRIGVTSIFVTHDQSEALAMSDKIIVMSAGNVEQMGTPDQVYNRPQSEFVARFLGASNVVAAQLANCDEQSAHFTTQNLGPLTIPIENCTAMDQNRTQAKIIVRSEKVVLDPDHTKGVPAVIKAVDYQGQLARYFLDVGSMELQAMALIAQTPLPVGAQVGVCIDPADCIALSD